MTLIQEWSDLSAGWLLYATLSFVAMYILTRVVYNIYFHPLAKVPGPYAWSALRARFVWSLINGTMIQETEKLHRHYGPILRIAPDEVTFARADAWNEILTVRQNHQEFLKDPLWWAAQPGIPLSILSAIDPKEHAGIRKVLAPGFTTGALREQEPVLHFYVNLLVERLAEIVDKAAAAVVVETGEAAAATINIVPWMNFASFDIFGDLGFGESFDCLQRSRYHPWIALLFSSVKAATFGCATRYYPLLGYMLKICIPPSLKKMARDHYEQIADKVQRRLNFELERPDIMSHVVRSNTQSEKGLCVDVINATFMILTTAGSETTATMLSGTLNALVNNPDKLEKLVREIRGRFQSQEDISLNELRQLPYLNAVIMEGLRLHPPVPWIVPRKVPSGGAEVCGIWLPGGTTVSIQAYALNRDPDCFHLASSFLPERWLSEASSDPASPFFNDQRQAVQPFSVGPRVCMGQHLARAEMRLILSKLIWTFDFEAIRDRRVKWESLRTFLLVEKKPIELWVRRREGKLVE